MKKYMVMLPVSAITLFVSLPQGADAQVAVAEVIQAGVKKVIRAVDLKIQRLQNKTVWLQNAQKVLENQLSKLRLNEIADWTEKQQKLYAGYYDELWKVKTAIAYYRGLKELASTQAALIREYRNTWTHIRGDPHFTETERQHMQEVYTGILDVSMRNIDQVLLVSSAFKTRMNDAERLEVIHAAAREIEQNYADLRQFNTQNAMLSMNRATSEQEINRLRSLYGLENE